MKTIPTKARDLQAGDNIFRTDLFCACWCRVSRVSVERCPCIFEGGGEGTTETCLVSTAIGSTFSTHPDAIFDVMADSEGFNEYRELAVKAATERSAPCPTTTH